MICDAITQDREYFSERFFASYLYGSLNYGDAIPNISDMGCYTVINDNLNYNDKSYFSSPIYIVLKSQQLPNIGLFLNKQKL